MISDKLTSWNNYVNLHPKATVYHKAEWLKVIEETYGHKTYFLAASRENNFDQNSHQNSLKGSNNGTGKYGVDILSDETQSEGKTLSGILPLVKINHLIFGKSLTSLPFLDAGGLLGDNSECERALLNAAMKLTEKSKIGNLELRHTEPLDWLQNEFGSALIGEGKVSLNMQKVRMVLDLPDSSQRLLKSFKSKLRSQINKPLKEGLKYDCGGLELLDDFYRVFLVNMRDLGSPVHSKHMMENVLKHFKDEGRIFVVRQEDKPLAGGIVIGFRDTLWNPWASSLRGKGSLNPNMLLYWAMLEYACDHGYRFFDFGRSTPGVGTYKFKEQWGARPQLLYWYVLNFNNKSKAVDYWRKLPVPITKLFGPMIRKYINL